MMSGVSVLTDARSVVSRYAVSGTEPLETALKRAKGRSERSSWSALVISAVDWFLMPSVIRRRGEMGLVFWAQVRRWMELPGRKFGPSSLCRVPFD